MSLTKKSRPTQRASAARDRALQAANQIGPMAKSARTTAAQRMQTAREWSAPRIGQAAQTVQKNMAPKVSAALEATAERIEPAPDKLRKLSRRAQRGAGKSARDATKRRAAIIAGLAGLVAAVLGAVSVVVARRSSGPSGESAPEGEPGAQSVSEADSGVDGQVPAPAPSSQ